MSVMEWQPQRWSGPRTSRTQPWERNWSILLKLSLSLPWQWKAKTCSVSSTAVWLPPCMWTSANLWEADSSSAHLTEVELGALGYSECSESLGRAVLEFLCSKACDTLASDWNVIPSQIAASLGLSYTGVFCSSRVPEGSSRTQEENALIKIGNYAACIAHKSAVWITSHQLLRKGSLSCTFHPVLSLPSPWVGFLQ